MTDKDDNPYSPVAVEPSSANVPLGVDAKLLKDFRSQILALGVLWIIFGLMSSAFAVSIFTGNLGDLQQSDPGLWKAMILVIGMLATGWLVSGVLSVMRSIIGVYTGLVLSYLALVASAIQIGVCWVVILIVIIVQAHRVIGFSKKLSTPTY